MPRRKVSTLLDEHLFRRAKLQAVRENKQISQVVGEALERHLAGQRQARDAGGVVARTWNSLPATRRVLRQALADDDSLFEA
jgi:hypothetical protein